MSLDVDFQTAFLNLKTRKSPGAAAIVIVSEKGELRGCYAVTVSGNWRATFRFADGDAVDVDYLDYH